MFGLKKGDSNLNNTPFINEKIFIGYDNFSNEMVYILNEFKSLSEISEDTLRINHRYHELIQNNSMKDFIYDKLLRLDKKDIELNNLKKEVNNEQYLSKIIDELSKLKFYIDSSNILNKDELIKILNNIMIKSKCYLNQKVKYGGNKNG